jgi:hypothetical protein
MAEISSDELAKKVFVISMGACLLFALSSFVFILAH